jgi:hypothetical protein
MLAASIVVALFPLLPQSGVSNLQAPLSATCAPAGRPRLAEVLYDATGDDGGREFVELFNPTAMDWPLAGVELEVGDGAAAGRWTRRWIGTAGDTVRAGRRFVIGGSLVVPAPDAAADLELQNGPDAVRLTWPDGAAEVLGYGALGFSEYACGAPAPDAPSGLSLARVPDESDRGSNALDFRAATPTPGRANQPGLDAALVAGSLTLDPEHPEPATPARLIGQVVNRGSTDVAPGALTLHALERDGGSERELAQARLDLALPVGESAGFEIALPPLAVGARRLVARVALEGDETPDNDADSLRVRIGPGPLVLTEIQFHPAAGEGEWVEVRNRSLIPLDLGGFRLSDRNGIPGTPAGGGGLLAPDSLALMAQDRGALLARHPALDASRVWQVSPWASLNNSDDSAGVADVVILREADGTPVDRAPYGASGVPAGVPLERRDDRWGSSIDAGGSPLRPPRELPPIAGRLEVRPRRIASGEPLRMSWSLPWPRARVAIEVFDLAGRRVARVIERADVPARGDLTWQPSNLPGGRYLISLRAVEWGGTATAGAVTPIRLEGER